MVLETADRKRMGIKRTKTVALEGRYKKYNEVWYSCRSLLSTGMEMLLLLNIQRNNKYESCLIEPALAATQENTDGSLTPMLYNTNWLSLPLISNWENNFIYKFESPRLAQKQYKKKNESKSYGLDV
jgi:hypothetical protein